MKNEIDIFNFDDSEQNFESYANNNGFQFWYARDLMEMLGYENYTSFSKAIGKAISVCASLSIPIEDNFTSLKRDIDGKQESDYKLSRFACYLTAMNGDIKKPEVAKAQAYFITFAEAFRVYIQESKEIERVVIREEITHHEKNLSSVVQKSGVLNYPFFQNKGYLGMYNMSINQLKEFKGIPDMKRSLLDFMGSAELAANLFRITQTEEKIKNDGISGQRDLESTAYGVGKEVRETMIRISGKTPEDLPLETDIRNIKKGIKTTHKDLKKLNKPEKK